MLVIAHLSDPHIDDGVRSRDRAMRVMRRLNSLERPIDLVLVTGDIADHGKPSEYEEAAKVLDSDFRVLTCPGNHDIREPFRRILLGEDGFDEPINRVHRIGGAVFLLCDSTIPGRDDGLLADETIEWLEKALAETGDDPVFVCFHHPPVTLGIPYVDEIRQFGADRLARVLDRHRNVIAILCGHAHTGAATTFAGVPVLVAPGVTSTILLPWEPGDLVDLDTQPAFAFHVLDDDHRRLTTHFRVAP